jgi:hypothetical protein
MSLLFIDSFDHYATADLPLKWSATAGTATINATAGRRGGGALSLGNTSATARKDLVAVPTIITGYAARFGALPATLDPSSTGNWMTLASSDAINLYFTAGPDGTLAVFRRTGTIDTFTSYALLGASTAAIVQAGVYAYIEVRATMSATNTGQVKLLVNGATVLNLTGIRTTHYQSVLEQVSRVTLLSPSSAGTAYDDLYICDAAGTLNNDFFGDVRIDVTRPNADGTYRDFTPDSGTDHFSRVNEVTADQLTYVAASTVGAKDSFQFTDLATIVGVVRGVQIVDAAIKDDAGVRSISHLAKSGVSEQYSENQALSTDRKLYTSIHETDPATGAQWTQAGLNAAEFGVVVAQ